MNEGRACQVDSGDSGKRVVTEMERVYTPTTAAQPAPSSPTPRGERLLFHIHGPWEADPETHGDRESWVHPQPQAGHKAEWTQRGHPAGVSRGGQPALLGPTSCSADRQVYSLPSKLKKQRSDRGAGRRGHHSRTVVDEGDTTCPFSTGVRTGPWKPRHQHRLTPH